MSITALDICILPADERFCMTLLKMVLFFIRLTPSYMKKVSCDRYGRQRYVNLCHDFNHRAIDNVEEPKETGFAVPSTVTSWEALPVTF